MALDLDIWIDRLRIVRREPGPRVEGETAMRTVRTPWIPARIAPESSSEPDDGSRPRVVTDRRELTCALYDVDGELRIVRKQDKVEVMASGEVLEFEVLSVQIPRDRAGINLLQYLTVVRREEF